MLNAVPMPLVRLAGVLATLSLVLSLATPTASAAPKLLPSEHVLSADEKNLALTRMTPDERAMRTPAFKDRATHVVTYVQRYFSVKELRDGTTEIEHVGMVDASAGQLDLPSMEVAGSASRWDLYLSLAVYRNTSVLAYEWRPQAYFEWNGTEGMDHTGNHQEDILAISWPSGLYLHSDVASGRYTDADRSRLDFYRSEVAETGVGWHFHEYRHCGFFCPRSPADYGSLFARIREDRYQNRTANVMVRYVHTKGGSSVNYSVNLGVVSIGVNPNDANQWSVAAYASFRF
ncbi:MAG: hypothetical protein ACRDGV_04955 [Candidatus Limnocylindria bacterium]